MIDPATTTPEPEHQPDRVKEHRSSPSPWVLVETSGGPGNRWVVAEGAQPRRHTRLERTHLAGSSTVAQHLPTAIEAAVTSAEPQVHTAYPPSGTRMRIMVVPVLGPADTVQAVQIWAGPRAQPVPPRPAVGTLLWTTPRNGVGLTSPALERMLDSEMTTATSRTLPDLMRHFEHIDDRAGLLRLFDESVPPGLWSAMAVTSGITTRARRALFICARSTGVGRDRMVSAVVTDVSAGRSVPEPAMVTRLIRTLPVRSQHAIALIDLNTGLVHEWVNPGPAPLDRWMSELPAVHPEDLPDLAGTRARLLGGAQHARSSWRVRFDPDAAWTAIHSNWTVLTRDSAPQAMLDLRVAVPAKRATPRDTTVAPPREPGPR
ncbi:GAF domain-containing protein [Nocardia sp. NPDC050710]|uniref:GAF domain-containing protein n=1 Tax=Nocardia sp. NPDC050710 TaxID=3157220 RepID=UPI00340AF6E0